MPRRFRARRDETAVKFRAAVLERVNTPLTIDALETAPLRAGDVLIRIPCSGLCHTDLEMIQGALAYPMPIGLGHEGAGVVEAVGAERHDGQPGDHVVCSALLPSAISSQSNSASIR